MGASETTTVLGSLPVRKKPSAAAMREGVRQATASGGVTILELSPKPSQPARRPVVDRLPAAVTD